MLKVLVVSFYFPPMGLSGVQRTLKFVKYMKNYSWEPTVITTGNVGYFAHDQSLMDELSESSVKVVRVGGRDPNSILSKYGTIKLPREIFRKVLNKISQTFFIPDNKLSWAKAAYNKSIQLISEDHFDLIFISAPPFSAFHVFCKIKKKFNIPIVIDYRDLWVDNQFSFYLTPIHKWLHKKKEYRVLKIADKIIATNRRIKEKLINDYKFLSFDDVFIINHGFDPKDFDNIETEKAAKGKLMITYAGMFYEFITPKYFFIAFKKLVIENPAIAEKIRLSFIGFLRDENRKFAKKLNIDHYIIEHGYLDHKETITKLMNSDVLWLMVGNGKSAHTISSGKLYEYFGTKKPIIACLPEGALKLATSEYKAAYITEPDNIDEIKKIFIQAYNDYDTNNFPEPNIQFVETFRRDFLTEQLTKQFNLLVKSAVV